MYKGKRRRGRRRDEQERGGGGEGVEGEKEKKTCILASPFFCSLLSSLTKSANLPHRHRYAFHMYNICAMVMIHE